MKTKSKKLPKMHRRMLTISASETWEYQPVKQASVATYGTACGSKGFVPAISAPHPPWIRSEFVLEVSNLRATMPGLIVVGGSSTTWRTSKLPLNLAFMGMPNCVLLTSWDFQASIWSGGGKAQWKVTVPNRAGLLGATVFAQGWVLDKEANAGGIATSNGAKLVVGF